MRFVYLMIRWKCTTGFFISKQIMWGERKTTERQKERERVCERQWVARNER